MDAEFILILDPTQKISFYKQIAATDHIKAIHSIVKTYEL